MFRLALRTLPLFAVIASIAVALGAYMNFSGVRNAYLELIQSRLGIIAEDIEKDILSAVNLGIPITEQVTLSGVLNRLAATDKSIVGIEVIGPDGATLFASDRPTGVTPPKTYDLRRSILNDFGASIGSVVVRYDSNVMARQIDQFADQVAKAAIPAGLCAMLLGGLAALFIIGRLHRRARDIAEGHGRDAIGEAERALAGLEERVAGDA